LRASLAPDTDIILGATTEPSMEGRTQVILIVTGVGGRPMPASVERVPQTASLAAAPAAEDDLDLPTFLRRRVAVG
jgi:cell division GTPase FtsZ